VSEANEKKEGKKELKIRLSSIYVLDQEKGTIKLKNRKCPRCGNIMAYHTKPVARWTCGSCSFTDFVKTKS
jgi:small subunit ribosomal protein S27Ae